MLRCQPLEVELKYCNFIRQAEAEGVGGVKKERVKVGHLGKHSYTSFIGLVAVASHLFLAQ